MNFKEIGAMRGRNPENPSDRTPGAPTQQMLEINENGTSNCLTSVQKDNLVIQINPSLESGGKQPYQQNRVYDSEEIAPALCRGKSDLNVTEIKTQYNGNETETNAREILRLLLETVSENTAKEWRSYVASTFQQDGLLQSGMYEQGSLYQPSENGRNNDSEQQGESSKIKTRRLLRELWKRECVRCSPQRRESIKQLFRQLAEALSVLSHEDSQDRKGMQSRKLQWETQGLWILRQALSEIQKIRQSTTNKSEANFRIRKLTPREVFRLQGFPDSFEKVVSDTQLYKQAGNSITTNVIEAILKNLLK